LKRTNLIRSNKLNDRKRINWNRIITKALVVCSILFLPILGIHYRPQPNFDYSAVNALETENGAIKVDFDFLGGFDYEKEEKIPEKVKNLNGKTIKVIGFMLPIDFDSGVVKSFMLLKNQMGCCFGVMPRVNDFVYVEMPEGKSAKYMTDIPLRVTGKLEVVKENLVGGLYSMTADKVEVFTNY
jgi:hypothetical protein